jgi:SulP family sulfate permease
MDRLKRTRFLTDLSGHVYLSQEAAFTDLANDWEHEAPHAADLARGMI